MFTLDAGANVHVLYPFDEKELVEKFIENELSKYCQKNQYICDNVGLELKCFKKQQSSKKQNIMKKSTLLLMMFVGFLTSSVTAQETIWFDANWNITTKDKAEYYRPTPKKVDKGFLLVDYYMNGKKQMEGFSTVGEH